MGEKLKTAENPEDAVRRSLSEELSVTNNDSLYTIGFNKKHPYLRHSQVLKACVQSINMLQ